MLSTIITPCLSPVLQLPAPPTPLATYIQQVRSTQLPTLKPSSTCWNWTSQKRLLVGVLTLVLQNVNFVSEYVVDSVVETVDFAMGHRPAAPPSSGGKAACPPKHTKFIAFVINILTTAEVTTPTVLAALIYIDRAKPHLHIGLEQWALERVFLGSIIVASKVCLCSLIYGPLF
jgi:hypothetical protein